MQLGEQYFNDLLIDELQSTNEIENVFSTQTRDCTGVK